MGSGLYSRMTTLCQSSWQSMWLVSSLACSWSTKYCTPMASATVVSVYFGVQSIEYLKAHCVKA